MLEGRNWFKVDGAPTADLARLRAVAPDGVPSLYFDLLAYSNGGEGPLAAQPNYLCLDPATTVVEMIENANHGQADLQGFLVFGGNGGGEYLAFDTRVGGPWPIVMIDMVVGGESSEVLAPDFESFYGLIGAEVDEA